MNTIRRIEPLFSILGAIATIVALLISLPSNPVSLRLQFIFSNIFAPDGYEVLPVRLETIPKNRTFERGIGGTALLTEEEVTFSVNAPGGPQAVYLTVGGTPVYLKQGGHYEFGGDSCILWLFNVGESNENSSINYSFEIKCS